MRKYNMSSAIIAIINDSWNNCRKYESLTCGVGVFSFPIVDGGLLPDYYFPIELIYRHNCQYEEFLRNLTISPKCCSISAI